jgi:hypothetical protein
VVQKDVQWVNDRLVAATLALIEDADWEVVTDDMGITVTY